MLRILRQRSGVERYFDLQFLLLSLGFHFFDLCDSWLSELFIKTSYLVKHIYDLFNIIRATSPDSIEIPLDITSHREVQTPGITRFLDHAAPFFKFEFDEARNATVVSSMTYIHYRLPLFIRSPTVAIQLWRLEALTFLSLRSLPGPSLSQRFSSFASM